MSHRGGIASHSGASAKAGKRLENLDVAKLADAHASGACGVTPVLVQLQSSRLKSNGIQAAWLQVPAVLVCHPFDFILVKL